MEKIENIKRNDIVTPSEIGNLRIAIGWNPNKGKYEQANKNIYAHFSIKKIIN